MNSRSIRFARFVLFVCFMSSGFVLITNSLQAVDSIRFYDSNNIRVELNKTDPDIAGSRRSELARSEDEIAQNSEAWYRFSVYLPNGGDEDYKIDNKSSEIICQWHGYPDPNEPWLRPVLALSTFGDKWFIDRRWDANPFTPSDNVFDDDAHHEYVDLGSILSDKGKWVRWEFHVKWGWTSNTILEIFKNGKKVLDRTGKPNTTNDIKAPYWKLGCYKWDWKEFPDLSPISKRVLYFKDPTYEFTTWETDAANVVWNTDPNKTMPKDTPDVTTNDFYVSLTGSDTNPGTIDAPFKTLETARNAVSAYKTAKGMPQGGFNVFIRGGTYVLSKFALSYNKDSGESGKPITYSAYNNEEVRLVGGKIINPSSIIPMPQTSPLYSRLDSSAKDKIMQVDLIAAGILTKAQLSKSLFNEYEDDKLPFIDFFCNSQPMEMSRWPDSNNAPYTASSFTKTALNASGVYSDAKTIFNIENSNRIDRWQNASNIWVHGLFFNLYRDHYRKVSIDYITKTITLEKSVLYGIAQKRARPLYFLNLIEEITVPGEWYIDQSTGILYFWPPNNNQNNEYIITNQSNYNTILLDHVNYINLKNLIIEGAKGQSIYASVCNNINIDKCIIRNCIENGITFKGGGNNYTVQNSKIYNIGAAGISIDSGDRCSLTNGNSMVYNCEIFNYGRLDYCYTPAIKIVGCGNIVRNNKIYYAPHLGISFGGNEHLIEFNEIYNICKIADDSGAIYGNKDWGFREVKIQNNYVHDLSSCFLDVDAPIVGIYLDDCISGDVVRKNIICNVKGAAILHGGGRDNRMQNNIITNCNYALKCDIRGTRDTVFSSSINTANFTDPANFPARLTYDIFKGAYYPVKYPIKYQEGIWKEKYPELAKMPQDENRLKNDPEKWLFPGGSIFAKNIGFNDGGNETIEYTTNCKTEYNSVVTIEKNNFFVNPSLINITNGVINNIDFTATEFTSIGFEPIDYTKIGLAKSDVVVPVSSVSLSCVNATLDINGTLQLVATVFPLNATNKAFTFASSNTPVAIVDNTGKVTVSKEGSATITVTTVDGQKTATCNVTVRPPPTVPVIGISIFPSNRTLNVGDSLQLIPEVYPDNATNKAVTFASSETSIASVDNIGKVKASKEGSAIITVTTVDGQKTATCSIVAVISPPPAIPVTGISIFPSGATLYIDETIQLAPVISPANATNKAVTYRISDSSIATIDSTGKIRAVKGGSVGVTITTVDRQKVANFNVSVRPFPLTTIPVSSVSLSQISATLNIGNTLQLAATVLPLNATNKAVTFASSSTSVASVDNTGKVKVSNAGSAIITVKTVDGQKTATCNIVVNPIVIPPPTTIPVTGVSIFPSGATLYIGDTLQLAPTVSPANATNKAVTYKISDSSIATIDSTGKIRALKGGSVGITITTVDRQKAANFNVSVRPYSR